MLDKEEQNIDAVTVSTPDHCHAMVASAAIKLGKHVYCQKPLTQTVYEARYLRSSRTRWRGNANGQPGQSEDGLRRAVEVVQAGLIGNVNRSTSGATGRSGRRESRRPAGSDPVPAGFEWDMWLGPASPAIQKGCLSPVQLAWLVRFRHRRAG